MLKTLSVIAGPNGAGKSTLAEYLLAEGIIINFINADVISIGIGNIPRSDIESGRIMLERLEYAMSSGLNFSFETTLSGKIWKQVFERARKADYRIKIFYMALSSPNVGVQRVSNRVALGGHHLPSNVIIRRYRRSLKQFREVYSQLSHEWALLDNSANSAKLVASSTDGCINILDPALYALFMEDEIP